MFAVRQWPGNGADLDFRGVLEGCTAAIVAAAPIEGTLLNDTGGDEGMRYPNARKAFLESDEYAAVAKVLPFCRLWCVRGGKDPRCRCWTSNALRLSATTQTRRGQSRIHMYVFHLLFFLFFLFCFLQSLLYLSVT